MIRYALACDGGHEFESWFPSSASYDTQAARGLVTCVVCGSSQVEKRLMAPALGRVERTVSLAPSTPPDGAAAPPEAVSSAPAPVPPQMALMSEREAALRGMLRALREHVVKTADYVGTSFPDEARRMHYGEIEHRSIYGEADAAEAKSLLEEGIEVHPLPVSPDDRN